MLDSLLTRGDVVQVTDGRLDIKPASGEPIPEDWFTEFERGVVKEILDLTNRRVFVFTHWGLVNTHNGGIRLEFLDIMTGEVFSVFYGVCRKRVRNADSAKAGDSLKGKRDFRVTPRSKLEQLWERTGLEKPRRNSEYRHKMRLLEGIYFQSEIAQPGLLDKDNLRPLTIPADFICQQFTDKKLTNPRQDADNSLTDHQSTNNSNPQSNRGMQPVQPLTTGESKKIDNRGDEDKGHTSVDPLFLDPILPKHQSVDYWVSDYDKRDAEIKNEKKESDVNAGFSLLERQDELFYKRHSEEFLQKQLEAMKKTND
jgi:hypothetical protein